MSPFDRPYTTWSAVLNIALFVPFLSYLTFNNIVALKRMLEVTHASRSFKLVPFETLAAISYLSSIVTMSVSFRLSVCPSVSPSHAGVVCKRSHISSRFFHLRVAPPF